MKNLYYLFILAALSGCSGKVVDLKEKQLLVELDYKKKLSDIKLSYTSVNIKNLREFYFDMDEDIKNHSGSLKERIESLNLFINGKFVYETDKVLYGQEDHWATVIEMIGVGFRGDCEDFTFLKIALSKNYGISKENVFLGYTATGGHVFPIFFDGKNYLVDEMNRSFNLIEYAEKYSDLVVFSLSEIQNSDHILFSTRRAEVKKVLSYNTTAKLL